LGIKNGEEKERASGQHEGRLGIESKCSCLALTTIGKVYIRHISCNFLQSFLSHRLAEVHKSSPTFSTIKKFHGGHVAIWNCVRYLRFF
jgi:hypothetical protein